MPASLRLWGANAKQPPEHDMRPKSAALHTAATRALDVAMRTVEETYAIISKVISG